MPSGAADRDSWPKAGKCVLCKRQHHRCFRRYYEFLAPNGEESEVIGDDQPVCARCIEAANDAAGRRKP